ncbi:unnamed protein product [marine sediment metagenome]|uniref:Ribosomal RNA adenine methylase transferase N-terminal domain-containing protein n=1 Tax=marine sediment metagenome TaxID=412755 RepID=X0ZB97_9ZZZZ
MDLTSIKTIKEILKKQGIQPSKRLGQNFLINKKVLFKIISSADITKKDIILEIGPGLGTLTLEIAKKAKKVITVEKDPKMIEILKETLKNFKNVKIIQGDILKYNFQSIFNFQFSKKYKIVANLPYYIVSPVIRKFLESKYPPKEMFLMVQKEVAQRICAKPPKMSILAVAVQFYAEPKILFKGSKGSFWPQPKVDSAFLKIKPFSKPKEVNPDLFFKIVKAGFSHPRKQLANNLSKGLALSPPNGLKLDKEQIKTLLLDIGIEPSIRAEVLTIDNWIKLTKAFK